MTDEQIMKIKEYADRYQINQGSKENMFLLMAVSYDMNDTQIENIIKAKDMDLPKLNLYFLSLLLMTEEEQKDAMDHWSILVGNERDILDGFLQKHYVSEMASEDKGAKIRKMILDSKNLKANQIDEVLNLVKVGVPEDEILSLIKGNKSAAIMKRYAEFFTREKQ